MKYHDTIEQAGEYLRLALANMGQQNIPTDPVNYTIWYEYVSGRNQRLKAAIEGILEHCQPFTPEVNYELYTRYFIDESKIGIEGIRHEIRVILAGIIEHIMNTGGEVSRFEETLETCSQKLSGDLDVEGMHEIVEGMISEVKTIGKSSKLFKEQLVGATQEIETLRKDLEKVKQQANTDFLTGLANRRAFEKALAMEVGQSAKTGKELCFLMVDLDFFKRINSTCGHLIGDKVLRMAATMIKDCVKGRDLVARYGGDEFVIMLPDTPIEGAITVAENIRSYFEAKRWKKKDTGQPIGTVTLSLGVSLYRHGEPFKEFIGRADKALRLSKDNGRNLVTCEDAVPSLTT